jgi:hypothetical protein
MAYSKENPYRTFERPYLPNDHRTPATYRLNIGPYFYFGSGRRVGSRVSYHTLALERGKHTNKAMQNAWDAFGTITFTILDVLERKPGESKKELTRRLEMHEQWHIDSHFGTPNCLNASSDSGFNSGASRAMKAKWADPEWRARQIEKLEPTWVRPVSESTRAKMAAAKTGARNLKSRACIFVQDGKVTKHESSSMAAAAFGVSQQCMDQWLKGLTNFPGISKKATRKPKCVGLIGAFQKPRPAEKFLLQLVMARIEDLKAGVLK